MQHVLPHVADANRVMRKAKRILKPGGLLLIEHPLTNRTHDRDDGQGIVFGRADWEDRVAKLFETKFVVALMPTGQLYGLTK